MRALVARLRSGKPFHFVNFGLVMLTFLSAVSFTLCSFFARLFSPETLPSLIEFQASSVFLAFIVQSGLRAGMRNQHHLGRVRVVKAAEMKIRQVLPYFAALISAVTLLQSTYALCPAFAILHAVLSLLLGLRFAQGSLKGAAMWSILTFLSIILPCSLILFSHRPLMDLRLQIEIFSILCLIGLAVKVRTPNRSGAALLKVIRSSAGMQLGAFSLYFLNFVLGHYIIYLSKKDLQVAVAYADIQVLCGVQSLIFSRVYLLIEGKVLKGGKVFQFSTACLVWTAIFALGTFATVFFFKGASMAALYGILAFSNLGNIALGTISQFMKEEYRAELLILTFLSTAVVGGAIFWESGVSQAVWIILLGSPTLVAAFLLLRSAFMSSSFFIKQEPA